jgi:hypothetical protein
MGGDKHTHKSETVLTDKEIGSNFENRNWV